MGFDLENFGIGLVVGWASAYAVYRARHSIQSARESVGKGAATVQNSATRSADSRYISDLIEQCETMHIAGRFANLTDIIIEPRFLPSPEFAAPPENDVVQSVYRVVPNIPDHPYLQAPFNIETLSINELGTGANALALLGVQGSGRTTALLTIALHSLGKVRFVPPRDAVQERLDAEEAKLEEKERAVRVQERVVMEQRARERLANEAGLAFDKNADEELKNAVPLFNRLMPVYVHAADLNATSREFGSEADPAEHLVRAVQYSVKRVTASTIPRNLYSRLNRGQVLLLLDGYDDLPEDERPAVLVWLKAYLEQYRQNFLIVAGPAKGYGPLLRVGLTPVFMRPWSDLDIQRAAERWAEAWSQFGRKRRKSGTPDPEVVERAQIYSRGLTPLEVTLKLWSTYADDAKRIGIDGWLRSYMRRHVANVDELIGQMSLIGALQLDEGFISSSRLQALAIGGEIATKKAQPSAEETGADGKRPVDTETASPQGRLLGQLRREGLLIRYRGDRYQFRHPLLAAYLGSLAIKDASLDQLRSKAGQPSWSTAIAYSAMTRSLDELVRERMKTAPDLLLDNVVEMSRWLAYAEATVEWRGPVLNHLGNQLLAPSQYPYLRERVAAALIDSRDKNALLIFRRAARNMDGDIRRLACLGMGALGDPEALRDLSPLMNDQDANVQLAAGMALGAIGTEEALRPMVIALTSGTEQLRQAMAEAFAAMPKVGYPTLYDAVSDEDFLLRRAAIFGLRRLRTTWALVAIYRTFLEDEQWYVRSAAQQAFQELTYGRSASLTEAYPKPENIVWLQSWAARQGENVPPGEAANQMLLRALTEGDAPIRTLAASNMGQLGMADTMRALYAALRDGREEVRSTAHKALGELQLQIGYPLPAPM
ncbi:MAG: HEAT repeat domain-containing protein [Anaerolineae bacterium]